MKQGFSPDEQPTHLYWIRILALLAMFLFLSILVSRSYGATKTSTGTGNWNTPGTWSPSGVPAAGDDVIIHGGHVVTIDSIFTCNNLDIGDATSGVTTLQITIAGNGLTINGNLRINPNNFGTSYTLDAGPGSINVANTFNTWSTTGTNSIKVGSAGTLTFAPAVTIASANQNITFTAAGTINFNSTFTDNYNKLTTFAACVVNFAGAYSVNTTAASWGGKGTAYFSNTASITANSNLTLFNVQLNPGATTTLSSAAGTVIIGGGITFASGSTFLPKKRF